MPEVYIADDVPRAAVAVLVSGGVESATLAAQLRSCFERVYPVYVRFGLSWESAEEAFLTSFFSRISSSHLQPLKVIDLPVWDFYGSHWSTTGQAVPDRSTADEAVFLPGRNVLLVAKTAVWCSLHGINVLAVGHLQSNPFPDATSGFFEDLSRIMVPALDSPLRIIRPLPHLTKSEVLRLAADLPLDVTFSCIAPAATAGERIHCGRCNKCEERRRGFAQAGITDPTTYASGSVAAASDPGNDGRGASHAPAQLDRQC